jgi:hypothetical protein
MPETEIPRAELEAIFKDLKKRSEWTIMKIYDDGGIKLIDDLGIFKEFDHYEQFLAYVRRLDRERR